jgi:uncharacterized protein
MAPAMETPALKAIDPIGILRDHYAPGSAVYDILARHGDQVAAKALAVAGRLGAGAADSAFLYEAAMLHDIGIGLTDTPALGCHGKGPYIRHGILGRELLENRGLPRHALVCERHVGVGLSLRDIRDQGLPLPARDMRPVTMEEKIICYADKFFSKDSRRGQAARSIPEIVAMLRRHGAAHVRRFQAWSQAFENDLLPTDAQPD